MKGQASIEYVFVLAIILTLLSAIALPATREMELNAAFSAARLAIVNYTAGNASLDFTTLNYTQTNRTISLMPNVYYSGSRTMPQDLNDSIIRSIQSTIASATAYDACAHGASYDYCVTS